MRSPRPRYDITPAALILSCSSAFTITNGRSPAASAISESGSWIDAPTIDCGASTSSTSSSSTTSAAPTAPKRTAPSASLSGSGSVYRGPRILLPSPQSIIVITFRTPDSTRGIPEKAPSPIEPCTQIRTFLPWLVSARPSSRTSSRSVPTRYESISMLSSGGVHHTLIRRLQPSSAIAASSPSVTSP